MKIAIVTYKELSFYQSVVPNEDQMVYDLLKNKEWYQMLVIWGDSNVKI